MPTGKLDFQDGAEYSVAAVDETTATLVHGPVLTHEQAAKMLGLLYAMTHANAQGHETEWSITLHDTDNDHFTTNCHHLHLSHAKSAAPT